MKTRFVRWSGAGLVGAVAAGLLLVTGCAGDRGKLVGTWSLDMSGAGEFAQAVSMTMTFDEDGTGTMKTSQTVDPEAPGVQTARFRWELEKGQVVISMREVGMTQKMDYEFDEDGALSLKAGQGPAMKYYRVQ